MNEQSMEEVEILISSSSTEKEILSLRKKSINAAATTKTNTHQK